MSTLWEGSMRRSLQEARRKMLKLLYFIDSPGGSALTSDLIWRELELTKKSKADSGFYGNYAFRRILYACNANTILPKTTPVL
jgi:protease-4